MNKYKNPYIWKSVSHKSQIEKKLENDFIDVFSKLKPSSSIQTPARVWTRIRLISLGCNFESYKDNMCLKEKDQDWNKLDQSKL